MLRKLLATAVTIAACTLNVPTAHAAVVRSGCGMETTDSDTRLGSGYTYTGYAYGYAAFDDTATHSLRCYIQVDWAEQDTTGTGFGTGFVVAQSQVTYDAYDGQVVELCTEIDGVTVSCDWVESNSEPPQPIVDAVDQLVRIVTDPKPEIIDPILCPLLASLSPGIPGVVDIAPEGDTTITLFARVTWDCPPYGNLAPAP